jgi:large subunit ribosomal protein L16
MNFIPKINKIKKKFKGKNFNKLFNNVNANSLFIGSIGLQAQEAGNISSTVFEATKQSIKKVIKKAGRVIFIGFPQHAKTKKPLEMRMGKGKGNVDH